MRSRYVRALVQRLARRAGLNRRVHPHALRHACAFEMVREGAPLPEVQRQLGHANLRTTSVYSGPRVAGGPGSSCAGPTQLEPGPTFGTWAGG